MHRTLAAIGAVACAAQASNAAITFTFDDPAGALETSILFETDLSGDEPVTTGTISYLETAVVELEVDGTGFGLGMQMFDASLTIDLTVQDVEVTNGGGLTVALGGIGGTFEFRDVGTDELILSAIVQQDAGALALIFPSSGGFFGSSSQEPGDPTTAFLAGPELEPFLNGFGLAPLFDFAFTLTNLQEVPDPDGENDPLRQQFRANTAFTATANIPSPGSLALAAAGLGVVIPRRRRR